MHSLVSSEGRNMRRAQPLVHRDLQLTTYHATAVPIFKPTQQAMTQFITGMNSHREFLGTNMATP